MSPTSFLSYILYGTSFSTRSYDAFRVLSSEKVIQFSCAFIDLDTLNITSQYFCTLSRNLFVQCFLVITFKWYVFGRPITEVKYVPLLDSSQEHTFQIVSLATILTLTTSLRRCLPYSNHVKLTSLLQNLIVYILHHFFTVK